MINAFSVQNLNDNILNNSTSGGFFNLLCQYVIQKHGYIVGAEFNSNFEVEHNIYSDNNYIKFLGSKYVQSNFKNVLPKIRDLLLQKKLVLFSGTPCQNFALIMFLGKHFDNLILVEVICHGVSSPKLFRIYLEQLESKYKSKIQSIQFRSKKYGYLLSGMEIHFENGKQYFGSSRSDYMLKAFFWELSSRPSCYNCQFKGLKRYSDFSMLDCWNAEMYSYSIHNKKPGWTNVLVNSDKGRLIFQEIINSKQCIYFLNDVNKIIQIDGTMIINNAKPNKNRGRFYSYVYSKPLNLNKGNKYMRIRFIDKLIDFLKRFPIFRRIIIEKKSRS